MQGLLNDQFRALASAQRRQILVSLLEDDFDDGEPITVSAAVADASIEDDHERLHHVHLPKLEGDGYVCWDRDAGVLRRGPQFREIKPMVQSLVESETKLLQNID